MFEIRESIQNHPCPHSGEGFQDLMVELKPQNKIPCRTTQN